MYVLDSLSSNQDEADTRIVLHALHESSYSKNILVKSVDTDVLILLIHYYTSGSVLNKCKVFMQLGHSHNQRIVAIRDIVDKIGTTVSQNLLAIHSLTGCDTTSAFYKIGKKTAFDILMKNAANLKDLQELPNLPFDRAQEIAVHYVLLLYKNKQKDIRTLNELRLFFTKNTNRSASEIPPTDDAFKLHLQRFVFSKCKENTYMYILW